VDAFTVPFTSRVIGEMLGVPTEDQQWVRPRIGAMMSTTRFTPHQVATAHKDAEEYFGQLVRCREAEIARGRQGKDLLAELLAAPPQQRLSRKEIVTFGAGLLMAGYETTSNQLAMCVLMTLSDLGLYRLLRAEPTAVPAVIEEMLRWSSLVATGGAPHVATEDARVGTTLVHAGQVVVPLTDAANQDGSVFQHPATFSPRRAVNSHLAFGHGRHYCLGAHLARAELRVGLSALLYRLDGLRLAVPADSLPWRRGMFIRGPAVLPVTWR
jgi:nocardicin N-oxygenase